MMPPVADLAPAAVAPEELPPADLAEVGRYRSASAGFDHGLVALALGQPYWLVPADEGYRLLVAPEAAEALRDQLARFDRESVDWPPEPERMVPAARLDLLTPLLWALAVVAVFSGQSVHPAWVAAGAVDAVAIYDRGEVWRAFTALFLHVDASHLASNLLGGLLVFAAVLSTFGRVRGWSLIGLAAVAGNLAVAAANHPDPHASIGASTAVFAAVGLLTGRAVRRALGTRHPHRGRAFFVPLAAGLTVLGLHGAGGPAVDVLAHGAGFAAGAILGALALRVECAKNP